MGKSGTADKENNREIPINSRGMKFVVSPPNRDLSLLLETTRCSNHYDELMP